MQYARQTKRPAFGGRSWTTVDFDRESGTGKSSGEFVACGNRNSQHRGKCRVVGREGFAAYEEDSSPQNDGDTYYVNAHVDLFFCFSKSRQLRSFRAGINGQDGPDYGGMRRTRGTCQ